MNITSRIEHVDLELQHHGMEQTTPLVYQRYVTRHNASKITKHMSAWSEFFQVRTCPASNVVANALTAITLFPRVLCTVIANYCTNEWNDGYIGLPLMQLNVYLNVNALRRSLFHDLDNHVSEMLFAMFHVRSKTLPDKSQTKEECSILKSPGTYFGDTMIYPVDGLDVVSGKKLHPHQKNAVAFFLTVRRTQTIRVLRPSNEDITAQFQPFPGLEDLEEQKELLFNVHTGAIIVDRPFVDIVARPFVARASLHAIVVAKLVAIRLKRAIKRRMPVWHVKSKGVVIADETGTGKTLQVIAAILAQKLQQLQVPCPPVSDKPKLTYEEARYSTRATLIVVPPHLCGQWQSAADDYRLNRIVIITKLDHARLTMSDFIQADVVIVSLTFLTGAYYKNTLKVKRFPGNGAHIKAAYAAQSYLLHLQRTQEYPLDTKGPMFEHFVWYAIAVDEAHEVLCQTYSRGKRTHPSGFEEICGIRALFAYYVSATPHWASIGSMCQFLRFTIDGHVPSEIHQDRIAERLIKEHFSVRCTKADLSTLGVPDVIDSVVEVRLSLQERFMYDILEMGHHFLSRHQQLMSSCFKAYLAEKEDHYCVSWVDKLLAQPLCGRLQDMAASVRASLKVWHRDKATDLQIRVDRQATGRFQNKPDADIIERRVRQLAQMTCYDRYFELIQTLQTGSSIRCSLCTGETAHYVASPCGVAFCEQCVSKPRLRCSSCQRDLTRLDFTRIVDSDSAPLSFVTDFFGSKIAMTQIPYLSWKSAE